MTPLKTGRFRWEQLDLRIQAPADADTALQALAAVNGEVVADVRLSGTCNMTTLEQLTKALQAAELRAAAMACHQHDLELAPTEADLQALHADGFIGETLQELKTQLRGSQADVARDALTILARLQRQATATGGATAA